MRTQAPAKKSSDLSAAIEQFPLLIWLQQHFNVRDSGRESLRIDCPVCKGARTLSVNRTTKTFHCFKCDEGARGGAVWTGTASLFAFIALFEKLSPKATADRIRSLAGIPDAGWAPRETLSTTWPREAVQLSQSFSTHPSVQMLVNRGVGHLVDRCRVCVEGEFSHRILLPNNFFGAVTGFEAKSYVNAKPKSLLRHFTQEHAHVYTTWSWDKKCDFCVVTESILDAETLGVNAIGIFGSVLRDEQVLSLLQLRAAGIRRLVWFLDGDAVKKQANSIRRKTLLLGFDNLNILSEGGEDPNSLGRERCWNLVSRASPIGDSFDLLAAA